MKLTIDTKEESKEELRRVIAFLQHIVGEPSERSVAVQEPTPTFENGVFPGFFDDAPKGPEAPTAEPAQLMSSMDALLGTSPQQAPLEQQPALQPTQKTVKPKIEWY